MIQQFPSASLTTWPPSCPSAAAGHSQLKKKKHAKRVFPGDVDIQVTPGARGGPGRDGGLGERRGGMTDGREVRGRPQSAPVRRAASARELRSAAEMIPTLRLFSMSELAMRLPTHTSDAYTSRKHPAPPSPMPTPPKRSSRPSTATSVRSTRLVAPAAQPSATASVYASNVSLAGGYPPTAPSSRPSSARTARVAGGEEGGQRAGNAQARNAWSTWPYLYIEPLSSTAARLADPASRLTPPACTPPSTNSTPATPPPLISNTNPLSSSASSTSCENEPENDNEDVTYTPVMPFAATPKHGVGEDGDPAAAAESGGGNGSGVDVWGPRNGETVGYMSGSRDGGAGMWVYPPHLSIYEVSVSLG
ncbi:uncharacterized protein EV422DRAFT_257473 [Fimicolochytrium jonesii]|uniref:uncharacterized protein n=1 Tax=Fimicolochytrium jonesii TaxID=1396493 RepID=UPI0022FDEA43|nr:uncharacterized protein EV422DRAFT_257473 [Fimicolochytrium jonesii]KAI8817157.1 hypothetical protein EV422DRAFT_257473 [Fimicolochytrium jonesii]